VLAITTPTRNRPGTHYRGYETTVNLYDRNYRAVVVHSSAHDRRRQKRLQRQLETEHKRWSKGITEIQKTSYFCREDADAAVVRLQKESLQYHELELRVVEKPQYARGRPKADGTRALKHMHYGISAQLTEKAEAIAIMKEEAGCFVLLTNVPPEGPINADAPYDGKMLLKVYKDQNGIEHNFGFLKDPVLVNAIFLKKPERVEALGLILVISLLLWRLIELTMRQYLEQQHSKLPGWNKRPTERPTTFMMTTKFESVQVIMVRSQRLLGRRLSQVQQLYLAALGLTSAVFTQPVASCASPGTRGS
jgi:transposase